MLLRALPCLLLCALALAAAANAQESQERQAEKTVTVYQAIQDRVVQVRVIDINAESKAGIGSGFAAGQPGWLVTNYHVIANQIDEPGKYRIEWLNQTGDSGVARILAVDVVHDLAVLQAEGLDLSPLQLSAQLPEQGSRIYAMGNPHDLGFIIVEGNFNGLLERSLYEKIHFTGSINPGMSGGPAVNARGELVGVNVATAGNQLSFLVPAHYAAALLAQTRNGAVSAQALRDSISRQLLDNQAAYIDSLLERPLPVTQLNGYQAPGEIAGYINCWGNSETGTDEPVNLVLYSCQSSDDIYLSGFQRSGVIRYQHNLISSGQLGSWRFYKYLENRSQYPSQRLDGDEDSVTDYQCQTDFVRNNKLPMKAVFCIRAYRKFSGLHDAYLTVFSMDRPDETLQSTLAIAGVSRANALAFAKNFLQAIGRQP